MNDGKKCDKGKADYSLCDFRVFKGMADVLLFGANKYGAYNWKKVKNGKMRYKKAAMRHFLDWFDNPEGKDDESGLLHIDHLLCCLYFIRSGELED